MAQTHSQSNLPDWWARENQRRQLRVLILLSLILILVAYFYYTSATGHVGIVNGVNFNTADYVAFIRQQPDGNTDIYAVRADGSDLRRLTLSSDHSQKADPAWTIDGGRLLYVSNLKSVDCSQVYLLGSQSPVQLTYGTFPKQSPIADTDGKHAGFITEGAIKTVYLNGNDVEQLLPAPRSGNQNSGDREPIFDPVGPYQSASFASDGVGIGGVQQLSSENDASTPMLSGSDEMDRALPANASNAYVLDMGRFVSMQWSAKGNSLISAYAERYVTDNTGKTGYIGGINLWDFDKPGKPPKPKPILACLGYTMMPHHIAWSPDGKKIAFEGWEFNKDGSRKPLGIYIMDMPQTTVYIAGQKAPPAVIPVTKQGYPERPQWSPDGSKLLFDISRSNGKHDIWVINSDLTNPINLTKGVGDNTQAVWSPRLK